MIVILAKQQVDIVGRQDASYIEADARLVSWRLAGFVNEKAAALSLLASQIEAGPSWQQVQGQLERAQHASDDFWVIELVDSSGKVLSSSDQQRSFDPSAQDWFRAAKRGPITSPVYADNGQAHFVVASPVTGTSGGSEVILLGDIGLRPIQELLVSRSTARFIGHTHVVDSQGFLIASTEGNRAGGHYEITWGAKLVTPGTQLALSGKTGTATFTDETGSKVLAGYAPVKRFGWGVLVEDDTKTISGTLAGQRNLMILLLIVASTVLAVFAYLFSGRITRWLQNLAHGIKGTADAVMDSSSELASASQEFVATATQQTAGVVQMASTLAELSKTAANNTDSIDEMAVRANKAAVVLDEAKRAVLASVDSTVALSERVNEATPCST